MFSAIYLLIHFIFSKLLKLNYRKKKKSKPKINALIMEGTPKLKQKVKINEREHLERDT